MIILPNSGRSADLPVNIFDPSALTLNDEEMLVAMAEHPPITKFSPGDLGFLVKVPIYARALFRNSIPKVWQVRFIISKWQHELMRLVNAMPVAGIDHALRLLDSQGFRDSEYRKPVLYCHAFPHGLYPDTAMWLPEYYLRRFSLRDQNQAWETILDEAKAPFVGYDTSHLVTPYTYDLAPDLYSKGENLGRPFTFEEATVHTAALLGMEEVMFRPKSEIAVDIDHDIFKAG